MKRIIAIFFSLISMAVFVPQNGWGAKNCNVFACRHSNVGVGKEYVYAYDYATNWCFSCDSDDDSIGSDECDYNDVVFQINRAGRVTNLYRCADADGTEDEWVSSNPVTMCDCSDLVADANFANADVFYSTEGVGCGTVANPGHTTEDWCMYYKCKDGFVPSTDKKSCVDKNAAVNAEQLCRRSGGQWNSTESKCLCGKADRGDGKGDGQEYENPGASCKCSGPGYIWNETDGKCVNPDETAIEACKKSHGDWVSGACVCDEDKGLKKSGNICDCSDSGAVWYPSRNRCDTSPQGVCEGTGGKWSGGKCNCNIPNKNIKEESGSDPVRCECKSEDYGWPDGVESSQGCKLTNWAELREQLKEACEDDWGGTWSAPDANDQNTWECACNAADGKVQTDNKKSCRCNTDADFVQKSTRPPYRCEKTDTAERKQHCDAAKAAGASVYWSDDEKRCKCNDSNYEYDYATKSCIDKNVATAQWCKQIPGARMTVDGKYCLCVATKKAPTKDGKCPTTASGQSQNVAPNTANARKLEADIAGISQELKQISNTFDRSRWKNAEGSFNTARLASDSIAGVVLGTVGGVVTSNVIKKSQVKNGFEDINCIIGGQHVADYGDLFRVGIR